MHCHPMGIHCRCWWNLQISYLWECPLPKLFITARHTGFIVPHSSVVSSWFPLLSPCNRAWEGTGDFSMDNQCTSSRTLDSQRSEAPQLWWFHAIVLWRLNGVEILDMSKRPDWCFCIQWSEERPMDLQWDEGMLELVEIHDKRSGNHSMWGQVKEL